jgi:hypothetical protein
MSKPIRIARPVQALLAFSLIGAIGISTLVGSGSEAFAAGPKSKPPTIKNVITEYNLVGGVLTDVTVIIKGKGFGKEPAVSNPAPCGYTGDDYGSAFEYSDVTASWFAGGNNGTANCIGLTNLVWKGKKIEFSFGSAYGRSSPPIWWLTPGDKYTITVKGTTYSGSV